MSDQEERREERESGAELERARERRLQRHRRAVRAGQVDEEPSGSFRIPRV